MRNWLFSYSVPTNNDKLNLRKSWWWKNREDRSFLRLGSQEETDGSVLERLSRIRKLFPSSLQASRAQVRRFSLFQNIFWGGKEKKEYIKQQLLLTANDFFLALKEGEGKGGHTVVGWCIFFPSKTCTSLFRGSWVHTCAVLSGLDPNSEWATIKMFLQVAFHKKRLYFSINN